MEVVVLLVLILLNGFFAMSEISLVTARKARLQTLIDAGDRSAEIAARLGAEPTKFLSAIQIGITSVGMLSGIVGEATLSPPLRAGLVEYGLPQEAAGYVATGIVVTLITYFAIVIGELVPKRIGQTNAEGIARLVSRPIQSLALVAKPFVLLLSGSTSLLLRLLGIEDRHQIAVTEEEIDAVLAEGSEAGVIEKEEHRMVRNLFRLDDLSIVSLMTPRSNIVALDISAGKPEVAALLATSSHSRYPVVRGSNDEIVGVVSARELLVRTLQDEPFNLEAAAAAPVFVPESVSGRELLDSFRKSGDHMAFVINEYGNVLGLITLHDLLETITGAITSDSDDRAVLREDGSWLFDGQLSMHELLDHLQIREEPEAERQYRTLSGLVIQELERLPRVGDLVDFNGWKLEVVDMDGLRVDRILASREATPRHP